MRAENRIIESRFYDTVYGRWYYFTAKDSQLTLEKHDYLVIGTLASYIKTRDYFGADKVVAIYIDLEDGERLSRALRREKSRSSQDLRRCARLFYCGYEGLFGRKFDEGGCCEIF